MKRALTTIAVVLALVAVMGFSQTGERQYPDSLRVGTYVEKIINDSGTTYHGWRVEAINGQWIKLVSPNDTYTYWVNLDMVVACRFTPVP